MAGRTTACAAEWAAAALPTSLRRMRAAPRRLDQRAAVTVVVRGGRAVRGTAWEMLPDPTDPKAPGGSGDQRVQRAEGGATQRCTEEVRVELLCVHRVPIEGSGGIGTSQRAAYGGSERGTQAAGSGDAKVGPLGAVAADIPDADPRLPVRRGCCGRHSLIGGRPVHVPCPRCVWLGVRGRHRLGNRHEASTHPQPQHRSGAAASRHGITAVAFPAHPRCPPPGVVGYHHVVWRPSAVGVRCSPPTHARLHASVTAAATIAPPSDTAWTPI